MLRRFKIRPIGHVISTLTISGLMQMAFQSSAVFFVCLLAGIFIDLDHFLDYYLHKGPSLKIEKMCQWCLEMKCEYVFLFLHSLELIFLIWIIISIFKLNMVWVALAVGLTEHMMLDLIFNNRKLYSYAYLFSFRAINGFRRGRLIRSDYSLKT